MIPALTILRGKSNVVVRLVVGPEGESYPTARWQDKSRKVRRGRVAEELRCIKHLRRGARGPHSLLICTTHCDFATTLTSRAPTS